ncbi:hypothetical protein L226DRAFT_569605 [Lentinus tigrinus ALCF2SS1-7]|uniref:Uncharacterized protein n=1 Tax=Lentinus tigrinus ALCF2SS1-6 TaxID=1328759 RepID=A0A5C2SLF5_9APHY|nr:hypothetical protein L227DRAFT_318987 [Lentinus tigrinus ALCF2SS1-6]RPD76329.1 hypothetical protein L226DRAFT_569605 [Lentinus tigrinus ALCF2SS1-7]
MGFLKRFLSLGSSKSRKNRKKQNAANARVDAEGRILTDKRAQDPDTSANRLLRSSSTKFSVMSEIDYTSLPPLPPSVQDLLSTPSISPSPSLATVATTPGLQRNGTYVVKVHGRTTHSRTEFPHANPPISPTKSCRKQPQTSSPQEDSDDDDEQLDRRPKLKEVNFTPKDTSRMYKLRRDPSVASLLNLYDEKGCLDSAIFENSPPTPAPISSGPEGREPRQRTGSTLRQLLGGPEPYFALNANTEGDISWAERLLDEQLGNDSPLSSPDLETPMDTHFPDTLSAPLVDVVDTTYSSLDADSSVNYPAISSMEVEVSGSEEDAPVKALPVSKPLLVEPKTPQRASEVFGFLSRRNTLTVKERDLPPLPHIITPDSTGNSQRVQDDLEHSDTSLGEHLDATHSANTSGSTQLTSSDTNSHASHAQIQTAMMTKLNTAFAASTTSLNLLISQGGDSTDEIPAASEAVNPHTGTSNTGMHASSHVTGSSLSSTNSMKAPPSKIPHGPRPRPLSMHKHDAPEAPETVPSRAPSSATPVLSDAVPSTQRSASHKREAFTNIPRRQHHRVTSRSSALEEENPCDRDGALLKLSGAGGPRSAKSGAVPSRKRSTKPEQAAQRFAHDKENTPSPPRSSTIPVLGFTAATPMRHRILVEPPSPASSSELSPVARDMMNDLRQQRMRARQVERRRGI